MNNKQRLQAARQLWDAEAAAFDNEPDHGLRDSQIRGAWLDLLRQWLPAQRATILDIGCGAGTLSVLILPRCLTMICDLWMVFLHDSEGNTVALMCEVRQ